jgi:hypothetical protein
MSIFVSLGLPGSAARTKTPTDCCANTFRVAPICPYIAKPDSARSHGSSMKGPERPCSIKPQQTSSRNVLQRPVEPAAISGHFIAPGAPFFATGPSWSEFRTTRKIATIRLKFGFIQDARSSRRRRPVRISFKLYFVVVALALPSRPRLSLSKPASRGCVFASNP